MKPLSYLYEARATLMSSRCGMRLMAVGTALLMLWGWGGGAGAQAQEPPAAFQAQQAVGSQAASTNERISLDLKGVDILDVLKLLSQKSGLNFVAGRNVTGRVTIFVNDVSVWEAFQRIIDANELAYERIGDIVTVMTSRDYELLYGQKFQERKEQLVFPLKFGKAVQVATALNQLKSTIGQVVADEATNTLIVGDVPDRLEMMRDVLEQLDRPTGSRVYHLNYAEAEALNEKLQGMLSPVGMLSVDKRTNTVVLTDMADVLEKADRLVRAFDTPDGEVLIQAKIISVTLTDAMSLGIDWKRVLGGIDLSTRSNFDVITGDVMGGTATGGALKLINASGDAQVVIEALQKITDTNTLASPRIMVSNNQEARILVGTKEAFVTTTTTVPSTGSIVSSPQIEFVDVGTKLFVTPNIKRDGHVQLKIRPEVSSAETVTFQDNRIPIVTSTEAETTVLVKSGTTLIIGGLIDEDHTITRNSVPVLGDLPVIGALFRGTTDTKEKTELVVFLTPQIVLPDGTPFVFPEGETAGPEGAVPPEAAGPVPASYNAMVRQRLQDQLVKELRAAGLPAGSLAVSFILNQDGHVIGEPQLSSPQGEAFLQIARAAIDTAQPFPPFPAGSTATEVRFRMAVEYSP